MFIFLLTTILEANAAEPACTVPVYVNYEEVPKQKSEEFISGLDFVISEWNGATDKIQFVRQSGTRAEAPYGAVHVTWGSVTQNVPGAVKVASTFVSTGLGDRVSRARVVMDNHAPWCDASRRTDCFDMHEVLLHEFGHALGLNHSQDAGAVMFNNVLRDFHKTHITTLDVDMIQRNIPANDQGCDLLTGYLTWSRFKD